MATTNPIWLLRNSRSGSNSERAVAMLQDHCRMHGFEVSRTISFPKEPLPRLSDLEGAGVSQLAIFTGDGTLNAAIAEIAGWDGEVIVLPGGTMNLLSKRLHGPDAELETIIERVAAGAGRAVRPAMICCEAGSALASLLAGPGSAWASVREAMRDFDIAAMAEGASKAISETTSGSMVRCSNPQIGRSEGYPLIEFTPSHRGMQLDAYFAEGAGDVLQQSLALLRRNFREGPHTRLGLLDQVTLEICDGRAMEILIDGERATLSPKAAFTVEPCPVDLLATHHGF